jgi:hypothetical protein
VGSESLDPLRWKALVVLCVTNFMIILDAEIVILALPSIQQHLGMSDGSAQWVLSAYLLAFGGLLLFGGRLADLPPDDAEYSCPVGAVPGVIAAVRDRVDRRRADRSSGTAWNVGGDDGAYQGAGILVRGGRHRRDRRAAHRGRADGHARLGMDLLPERASSCSATGCRTRRATSSASSDAGSGHRSAMIRCPGANRHAMRWS